MNGIVKKTKVFIAMLCIICMSSINVMAEQDGSGSGGGQDAPFNLISQSINNGDSNIQLNTSIKLIFSKNIAGSNVRMNNISCFSLKDESGQSHNIDVTIIDDDENFDSRRNVTISANGLKSSTKYTLYISNNITAKNGQKLDKSYSILFTTKEENKTNTSSQSNSSEEINNQNNALVSQETSYTQSNDEEASNENSENENKDADENNQSEEDDIDTKELEEESKELSSENQSINTSKKINNYVVIIIFGVLALLIGLLYFIKKRK